jgi:hypothetical protein
MSVSSGKPLRVLLVKPYQRARLRIACPPLGLLYFASTFRQMFGRDVAVRLLDLMPDHARYFEAREVLQEFRPYVVGVSALNREAEESRRLALMIQTEFPGTIVAIASAQTQQKRRQPTDKNPSSSFAQPAIGSNR